MKSGQSRLIHGRDIGRCYEAAFGRDSICLDRSGAHLGQGNGGLNDHEVDMSSHEIVHRWTAAAIWYEHKARVGFFAEQEPGDLLSRGSDPLRRLIGVRLATR